MKRVLPHVPFGLLLVLSLGLYWTIPNSVALAIVIWTILGA